jgi:hypothetical protein
MTDSLEIQAKISGVETVKQSLNDLAQAEKAFGDEVQKASPAAQTAANAITQVGQVAASAKPAVADFSAAMFSVGEDAQSDAIEANSKAISTSGDAAKTAKPSLNDYVAAMSSVGEEARKTKTVIDRTFINSLLDKKAGEDVFKNLDSNLEKVAKDFGPVHENFDQLHESLGVAGKDADDHGGKLSGLKGMYDNLASGVKSWIAGYVGFQAIIGMIKDYISHLEQVKEIQKQIAEQSSKSQGSLHGLASSMGDLSDDGFRRARQVADSVGKAGGFESLETSSAYASRINAILGGKIRENMPIGQAIAAFAGTNQLSVEDTGAFGELLKRFGATKSQDSVNQYAAKLKAAYKASGSGEEGLGGFLRMYQEGANNLLEGGMGFDQSLEYITRIREAAANAGEAESAIRQLSMAAIKPEGRMKTLMSIKATEKGLNLSDIKDASQRMNMIINMVTSGEDQALIEQAMGRREYVTLNRTFRPQKKETAGTIKEAIAGASSADVVRQNEQYAGSEMAKDAASKLDIENSKLDAGRGQTDYARLQEKATAEYNIQKSRGGTFRVSQEVFEEEYVVQEMLSNLEKKKMKARESGDAEGEGRVSDLISFLKKPEMVPLLANKYGMKDEWMTEAGQRYQQVVNYNGGTYIYQDGRSNPRKSPGSNPIGGGDSNNQTGSGEAR